jgi:hypothetical protein
MATLRPLVTIEESTILGMTQDPRYVDAFPFLRQLKASLDKLGDCSTCGAKRNPGNRLKLQQRKDMLTAARHTFAHLPSAQKVVLKNLLGTRKVRVIYLSGKRRIALTY